MAVQPQEAAQWHEVDATLFETTIRPRGRPAILRNLVGSWPATQAGLKSPGTLSSYLKSFYSGRPAPLFEAPARINGRFFYNDTLDGFNFESKRASLDAVLDRLQAGLGEGPPRPYMPGRFHYPCTFQGSRKPTD